MNDDEKQELQKKELIEKLKIEYAVGFDRLNQYPYDDDFNEELFREGLAIQNHIHRQLGFLMNPKDFKIWSDNWVKIATDLKNGMGEILY